MKPGATWWRVQGLGLAVAGGFALPSPALAQTASFPDVEPAPAPPPSPPQPVAPAPPLLPPNYDSPPVAPAPIGPDAQYTPSPAPSMPPWAPAAPAFYPPVLPYRRGMPVPPGYEIEHRPASGLIAGGLVTLITAYGAAIVIGAGQDFENGTGWLAVPLLGPWGAIGARTFTCRVPLEQSRKCVNEAFDEVELLVFMTADGLVQGAGAALFLVGLASGHEELVRQDLKKVSLGPRRMGRDGWGLGVSGLF
jgi:hypothetical protein